MSDEKISSVTYFSFCFSTQFRNYSTKGLSYCVVRYQKGVRRLKFSSDMFMKGRGCFLVLLRLTRPTNLKYLALSLIYVVCSLYILAGPLLITIKIFLGSKFVDPSEKLSITGKTAASQIESLVFNVLQPAGFYVHKFTKLPYLCEGDLYDDFFLLNDYLFVLKSNSKG